MKEYSLFAGDETAAKSLAEHQQRRRYATLH